MSSFFHLIMEADGDPVEAFDPGPVEEAPADPQPAPENGDDGASPPNPVDDSMDELAGFDDSAPDAEGEPGGDEMSGDMSEDGDQTDGEPENQNLSEKANNALNQNLYRQLVRRNQDIEDTIEGIQQIIPVMPHDVIQEIDIPMNRLKAFLENGKQYAINKFVDSSYGENLLYFQKLDASYQILLDEINRGLKKVELPK